ncbi:hypothetical protein DPEC_G00174540 [Dallia pectoralis]|uniref:Uncharacterized protein n=1 Tax=Dallia pectoralis TaxID=75939 RepID=A0ACC2GEL0_DALPE|nr:hypothetical protein DPEC_G00174540 [Dallia pectoralis]
MEPQGCYSHLRFLLIPQNEICLVMIGNRKTHSTAFNALKHVLTVQEVSVVSPPGKPIPGFGQPQLKATPTNDSSPTETHQISGWSLKSVGWARTGTSVGGASGCWRKKLPKCRLTEGCWGIGGRE